MCVYCNVGDHAFRFDPPWEIPKDYPFVPQPISPAPITPWPLDRLKDYYDLLKKVKELEDLLGCPCEPNKADYLKLFEVRIKALEKRAAKLKPKSKR